MPFNFIEKNQYSIDYVHLFGYLNTHKFMRNTNIQRIFLEHWIAELWESDTKQKENFSNTHLYQHPFYYDDIEIYLHFDLTKMMKSMNIQNAKKKLSFSTFLEKDIFYEHKILVKEPFSFEKNLILLCEFPRTDTNFIVLQGEELLKKEIENKNKNIEIHYITSKNLLDHQVFCSDFDKSYYIFHLELNYIIQQYGKLKFNELQFLKKSYLNQTKNKF